MSLLETIKSPDDLRKLLPQMLPVVAEEVRNYLIDTVSVVGGHFASNLGTVELTLALHYVFNTPVDKLVWDVGHQTYTHKIITGRREELKTLRQYGGLSGFPKREESEYDHYNNGHAGTSISQALGEAVARDMKKDNYHCVAIIGDASVATGMALEAMNHAGHLGTKMLVILNDNEMSISRNVGSISRYLNNIISSHFYNQWKKYAYTFIKWLPLAGPATEKFFYKMEKSFKYAVTPGGFFEDLGFSYIGPTDGHNINQLVDLLLKVKEIDGPVLLHVITQKGRGYTHAENDPTGYHGVASFDREQGVQKKVKQTISLSEIAGKSLELMTEKDKNIAVITPAMIEGSGLSSYQKKFPDNLFDAGIAEQHAVTFAGSMTDSGIRPFLFIYSTFLTRALDQIIEDVGLMNLPLRLVIDRAGCVGPDGETHQGLFDAGFLLAVPNMTLLAPSSGQDLIDMLDYMYHHNTGPIAVRFPKASISNDEIDFNSHKLVPGKARITGEGEDLAIITNGAMIETALQVREDLLRHGIKSVILDLLWIKPLDEKSLHKVISATKRFVILDENYLDAGISGYILNRLDREMLGKFIKSYSFPSEPIAHGDHGSILKHYHIDAQSISMEITESLTKY